MWLFLLFLYVHIRKRRIIFWCILLGANEFGQLGDGTEKGRKNPKKVKQLQTEFVKFVSCGAHCTAAIAEPRENDGTISKRRLWIWGQNQVMKFIVNESLLLFRFLIDIDLTFHLLFHKWLQGSNLPRLFWGAFTPNMVSSWIPDVFTPRDVAVIVLLLFVFEPFFNSSRSCLWSLRLLFI